MNTGSHTLEQFKKDLYALGLRAGNTVMMHSSYKSLGGLRAVPAIATSQMEHMLIAYIRK